MALFYGSDTSCVSDLSLIDQQITNPAILIGQRLARRLQMPRGGLAAIGDDPTAGIDVRQYALGKMGPNERAKAEIDVRNECLKDEEVESITVAASFVADVLSFAIKGLASQGPFALTLNVSSLTVDAVFTQ